MPTSVAATDLVTAGECTPACLLDVDPAGSCECTCAGRHHAALRAATVALTAPRRAPRRALLPDVLAVLGAAERMHSRELLDALTGLWPDPYRAWTVEQLGQSLHGLGVRTRQMWLPASGAGGVIRHGVDRGFNRRGVVRADVLAALSGSPGRGPVRGG